MRTNLATGQVGGPADASGLGRRDEAGRAQHALGMGGAMTGMDAVAQVDRIHQAFGEVVIRHNNRAYETALRVESTRGYVLHAAASYGVTKLAMEQLAAAYGDNWALSTVVLRYFTVYGPGQRPDMALHRFIAAVAAGAPVTVYGDGQQVRDFTYVSDAAAATLGAVEADVAPASVFNVAGGSPCTVDDLLRLVSEHVGRPLTRRHLPARAGDVHATHGAIDRARRVLRWQPEVPLDDGVKLQVVDQVGGR